jgi:hypothetical protein
MSPIRLTDDDLDAVMSAARPIALARRDAFLQAVAAELRGREEAGAVYFSSESPDRERAQAAVCLP